MILSLGKFSARMISFFPFFFFVNSLVLLRGTFSEVKLGTHKVTGTKYAIKIMTKEEHNPRKKEIIDVEIEILKRVNHPNVKKNFPSLFFF
jgi:serine/threonine protein kinase